MNAGAFTVTITGPDDFLHVIHYPTRRHAPIALAWAEAIKLPGFYSLQDGYTIDTAEAAKMAATLQKEIA